MALREIRVDSDPVLRKKSRVVDEINDRIKILVEDMIETMYAADGVGLAAPQVGILKRICVIDIYDETGVKVLINPEIIEQKGNYLDAEGCLSIPGESGYVERPEYTKVKALNLEGEEYILEGEGLLSRAICHELDHLDGVLFTDKVVEVEEEA
ncbi:peptide deformylase [Acidaminobacter sp. JC074]|uniref:peptide deformylase n=1 Tax=Acidaminobacter sp. JC074 TaxID=2530199 RepID=UPI001F0E47A7|nr:peptide deformylase [Acidaminobacter sp. JC074]MCH4890258.1 peptide deformylase [Acidaminobacter sp. JC074]